MPIYEPITKDIEIEIDKFSYGPGDYPLLARAFDVHSALALKLCKQGGLSQDIEHVVSMLCRSDEHGLLHPLNVEIRWCDPMEANWWVTFDIGSELRNHVLNHFTAALRQCSFQPMTGKTVMVVLEGKLIGLSNHDVMRLEALDP